MVKRYDCDLCDGMAIADDGYFVSYDDYAAMLAENERLKSEAGYTAADVATAAADGFRDGVRSVDMGHFLALASWWQEIGERYGVRTFTGNDHKLFANELLAVIDAHKGE